MIAVFLREDCQAVLADGAEPESTFPYTPQSPECRLIGTRVKNETLQLEVIGDALDQ